jgi:Na+-transporting NADH:ubiquinone oxidoreductase subunit NqrD
MTARATDTTIANVAEAERAIANLNIVLDRLMETVEEETALVRASNLREAAGISEAKTELSRRYTIESERVMAARVLIAGALPDAFDALRKRNAAFQILLQTNLTVLATAHAVSEGIIRGVSGELARKRAPSTYGASGRANAPAAKASQPLAISRTL